MIPRYNKFKNYMSDQCVYARSVMGRMTSTHTTSLNSDGQFSQSQSTCNPLLI